MAFGGERLAGYPALPTEAQLEAVMLWGPRQVGKTTLLDQLPLRARLFFSELVKTRDDFLRDWSLHTWRTRERHEVDFILVRSGRPTFIEAKLAIHGARPFALDAEARKVFPPPHEKLVVTAGGETIRLDRETTAIPIGEPGSYLLDHG